MIGTGGQHRAVASIGFAPLSALLQVSCLRKQTRVLARPVDARLSARKQGAPRTAGLQPTAGSCLFGHA